MMTASIYTPSLFRFVPSGQPNTQQTRIQQPENKSKQFPPAVSDEFKKLPQDNRVTKAIKQVSDIQKLQHFLKALVQRNEINRQTAFFAWKAWQDLSSLMSNNLTVPNTGAGPDGEILFSWNYEDDHFELEIFPSGRGEFFYLNHRTNEFQENEYIISDPLPEDIQNKLDLFTMDI